MLRFETEADVPFLRRLYVSTRWEELAQVPWSDDDKTAFLLQQFDCQRAHYLTAYSDGEFSIIQSGADAVGRLYVFRSARDIRVVDIAFLPEWRGKGFGTSLLEALLIEGDGRGALVSVHVEVFNPARRLYERLGFRIAGEQGPYYLMVRPPHGATPETMTQANTD